MPDVRDDLPGGPVPARRDLCGELPGDLGREQSLLKLRGREPDDPGLEREEVRDMRRSNPRDPRLERNRVRLGLFRVQKQRGALRPVPGVGREHTRLEREKVRGLR